MNTTPRAARQPQTVEPGQAAAIIDQLRNRPPAGGTAIIEVAVARRAYHCFVGRHRDGSCVLPGIVRERPEVA